MSNSTIILAGSTGNLGKRIARFLLKKGAKVRALVRRGTPEEKVGELRNLGAEVFEVDFKDVRELEKVCRGGSCVVSALSGLREVIVGIQGLLLKAAAEAGVPRFIPSDFSIDFTRLKPGRNRNLDFRKEFQKLLEKSPVSATSILNGMFMDLLTGQAPFILFKAKKVLCWGDPDQLLDFTTIENTAEFTALASLDPSTPRFLRIAGDQISARELAKVASEVFGEEFKILKPPGGLKTLEVMIKITRIFVPGRNELYPPWQGMQYMRDMFSGQAKLEPLDNNRYPEVKWTTVRDMLYTYHQSQKVKTERLKTDQKL